MEILTINYFILFFFFAGKFSSVYINRPENKVAIYVNSAAQEEETYANCTDHDYENVE